MQHFTDHYQQVKKQTFDTAIITDSKGKVSGKIIVRYTDSQIGYNNETAILLYGNDKLNFGTTRKGSTYDHDMVYRMLRDAGAKVYSYNGDQFGDYSDKNRENLVMADSMSRCTDFHSFKIGSNKYNILWV